MTDDNLLPFCFPAVRRKKITAAFGGGRISSDGGVMLLAQADRRLGRRAARSGDLIRTGSPICCPIFCAPASNPGKMLHDCPPMMLGADQLGPRFTPSTLEDNHPARDSGGGPLRHLAPYKPILRYMVGLFM
jgi:hypothetical protein